LEQNTYNQCPVCSFPLSPDNAICPRCGNDIIEEISSLEGESTEIHTRAIENKKAEWYSRRLTDKLLTPVEGEQCPPHQEATPSDSIRHIYCSNEEKDFLANISRETVLKDSALRKQWWNALTSEWKDVVKNTLKLVRDPSEVEIASFQHHPSSLRQQENSRPAPHPPA